MLHVLIYFSMLSVEPAGRCAAACLALRLLGDVVDALVCTRLHITTVDVLRHRTDALLQACRDAGWSGSMIPKFHWMVHYSHHLKRHGCLPTCWVHERKHKVLKRYASDIMIKDLLTYSKSVIAEVRLRQSQIWSIIVGIALPRFGVVSRIWPCPQACCSRTSCFIIADSPWLASHNRCASRRCRPHIGCSLLSR